MQMSAKVVVSLSRIDVRLSFRIRSCAWSDSSLERSRRSRIISWRCAAWDWIIVARRVEVVGSSSTACSRVSAAARMAATGVRSSWEAFATKSVFILTAASSSVTSLRRRSAPKIPVPHAAGTGAVETWKTRLPSAVVSSTRDLLSSPARAALCEARSDSCVKSSSSGEPTSWRDSAWPRRVSAEGLQKRTRLLLSVAMSGSSIAVRTASRLRACLVSWRNARSVRLAADSAAWRRFARSRSDVVAGWCFGPVVAGCLFEVVLGVGS